MLLHLPFNPSRSSCSLAFIRRAAILDERLSASKKLPEEIVSPELVVIADVGDVGVVGSPRERKSALDS